MNTEGDDMTTKKSEILTAIHSIMQKVGYVQKKDKNDFHGYKYASEASLLEALRPAMLDAGLILIPSGHEISEIDSNGNTHVSIDYTLAHISGEIWPEKIRAFGAGNDRAKNDKVGDKGTYKAITGANKYLLFKLFQIETGNDPERDNGHEEDQTTNHQPGNNAKVEALSGPDGDIKTIIQKHLEEKKPGNETQQRNLLRKYAKECELPDLNNITTVEGLTGPEATKIKSFIDLIQGDEDIPL